MSEYDFSGLTVAQQNLILFQGWGVGSDRPQPSKRTVKKLIDRGLMVEEIVLAGGVRVSQYYVPICVHIAWCQYCSDQVGDEE